MDKMMFNGFARTFCVKNDKLAINMMTYMYTRRKMLVKLL